MIHEFSNELQLDIRKSRMFLHEVYFWTDTIKDWRSLLKNDVNKKIIMDCWRELVRRQKIVVYGFVIMPNHIHVLWEMIAKNGKEMPYASFNKFTSHQFLDQLRSTGQHAHLFIYNERTTERRHRFWQRDALAVLVDYKNMFERILNYIHLNPLQDHWRLADKPEDYPWSSAKFYETGVDDFGFLTHYKERF